MCVSDLRLIVHTCEEYLGACHESFVAQVKPVRCGPNLPTWTQTTCTLNYCLCIWIIHLKTVVRFLTLLLLPL
ncbi:hypothetical protein ILYODFUR_022446 [Ilyodon furcidens]|uniref:Uncharacterized protein n=1 Tax=Ilyodon furcidens TaxID=33524 RepID=A0ABV0SZ67_9TELE